MKCTRLNVMIAAACIATAAFSTAALATTTTVPQSALVASSGYYTDTLSNTSIGSPLTMTGGGNAANVGGQPQ